MCYSNDKLVYSKQVYYDNAEGNYLLEKAKLEKQNLILNSDDVNEGKEQYDLKSTIVLEWKPIPLVEK